jgi:hypothetical protein
MWIIEYQVMGHGTFPVDMLRYDTSYPSKNPESIFQPSMWNEPDFTPRTVTLHHRESHAGWTPTIDRWKSFGWVVIQTSIRSWKG